MPSCAHGPAARASVARQTWTVFLISVLGLFLELLLIRWVSTEIRIFAYLQNTVLVVCFLGLGMGCWDARRRPFVLRELLAPLTLLVALLAIPPTRVALGEITTLLSGFNDLLIWAPGSANGWGQVGAPVVGLLLTFLVMTLLWEVFVPVGRLLGKLMSEHPDTIRAYSANVAGSLCGIWLFVLASALYLPPAAWFAFFAAGAVFFLGSGGRSKLVDAGLLAAIVLLAGIAGYEAGWRDVRWTPYQKLAVRDLSSEASLAPERSGLSDRLRGERRVFHGVGDTFIAVNNTGYQATVDLRPETVAAHPDRYPLAQRGFSQYDLPARLHPNPNSVLIVGAGSGNDAAGALRNGAKRVVAVEIDPGIIAFGRKYHPEQPYADQRVEVVNDDARSYFATSRETFDVIAFGLLDSHTTTAMTNARLDHYVYTAESLAQARKLLNPGGIAVLSFEVAKPYVADRMATALEQVFGHKPVAFRVPLNGYGWGGVLFVVGPGEATVRQRIADQPRLAALVAEWQAAHPLTLSGATRLATDDWPYIYLEKPTIPLLYFLLAGVLALLFLRGMHKLGSGAVIRAWGRTGTHFFFLGAAFMLLEVQNISKAAVVLGNTWVVNAVIISGVMVMILLANLIAARLPRLPLGPVYVLLVASCLGLYTFDLSAVAFLPYATKAVAVGLLTSLPMLFSGIVFVRSFADADRKDAALGANLMGALAGGVLQSVTFVTGIQALLLIVAGLYVGALFSRPRVLEGNGSPPVGAAAGTG
ncbi:MAG TPA: methyltransferase domain-containing protein [Gemmataceae bacterium]|nr:methyltransferase domain-containing protein [Gemmataceae bacterium]